jgi:predicted PP-loop superfamily ATPase
MMQIFVPNAGKLLSKIPQTQTQTQTQAQTLLNLRQLRRRFNYGKPLLGRVNRFSSH